MLECRHEGETDRLPRDRQLGRITSLGEDAVRDGLKPGNLREPVGVLHNGSLCRAEVHRTGSAVASVQHVEADIGGDPVDP
jgi:hypothetical protein